MLYQSGTLYAETRAQRALARSVVTTALRSWADKIARLTQAVIRQLTPAQAAHLTTAQLLTRIAAHPILQPERAKLRRYEADFPELRATVTQACRRAFAQARRQLAEALYPHHLARRFAHTQGYRRAATAFH